MELPSCPSCKQSVLDDEAELCPFCGASLKKGAAAAAAPASPARRPAAASRPAAPAAASRPESPKVASPKPSTSPSRPAPSKPADPARSAGSPAAKASSGKDKSAAEQSARSAAEAALEESLKVDSSAGLDVPQASRQRSQTKSYKVRCPMCDTVGYVPRSSAGKEIRCANRDCMVPVFVAPRPEKKQEDEKPAKKPLTPAKIMMVVACLVMLGFAGYFVYINQPAPPPPRKDAELPHQQVTQTSSKDQEPKPVAPPPEKPLLVSVERQEALALMARASQEKSHNRSRPLCERLTAHTAADCGDLTMANEFLGRLQHAENGLSFYRVTPLTVIAWRQLKAGDRAAAKKTLGDAVSATAELPTVGTFSMKSAAWLAAALATAGQEKEARRLANKFPCKDSAGRLAAAEARATAWNGYNVDASDQERPLIDAPSEQLPLVVELMVASGFPTEALHFAQSAPDPSLQAECELAWVEAVARAKSAGATKSPATDAVLAKLKPAAQARCHARLGLLDLKRNDRAAAEAQLKAAQTALGSAKSGAEFILPPVKEIYDLKPADPEPARQNALAFAEIARLQAGLGQLADAHHNLAMALDCLRASAPSPAAVDARQKRHKRDRSGLRSDLKSALKLRDNQVEPAAAQYARNLRDQLGPAADARFALEANILDTALSWADPSEIWNLIGNRVTAGDPDRREPYLLTPLPWQLTVRLKSKGVKPDEGAYLAIGKVAGDTPPNPVGRLDLIIAQANDAEPGELVNNLKAIDEVERSDRERAGMIIADRLVAAGQFPKAFQFARLLDDPVMKEETMEWSAALACRLGQARPVKQLLLASNSSFSPTELVSSWRGFLIGLLAREASEPASASPAAVQKSPAQQPAAAKALAIEPTKQADSSKG
jgi:hypothetical protein